MIDPDRRNAILVDLAAYGSDFLRWPQERVPGAREAVLQDDDVRRAWERQCGLDRAIARHRSELDRELVESGAVERVRRRTLARLPSPLAEVGWRRIAAAVLVAGALGCVMDLYLAPSTFETADLVLLDPIYGLTETELQ